MGLLIDLDGTLYTNDGPIRGAREALERLDRAGIDYRFITNATHTPLREIAAHLRNLELRAEEGRIFTPAIAVAERLRDEGTGCYPLLDDALLEDFEGMPTTGSPPKYVLVGNLGEGFTYARLDAAFRHLVEGAELIALSKNRYWQTAGGEALARCRALRRRSRVCERQAIHRNRKARTRLLRTCAEEPWIYPPRRSPWSGTTPSWTYMEPRPQACGASSSRPAGTGPETNRPSGQTLSCPA